MVIIVESTVIVILQTVITVQRSFQFFNGMKNYTSSTSTSTEYNVVQFRSCWKILQRRIPQLPEERREIALLLYQANFLFTRGIQRFVVVDLRSEADLRS
jgi:hypothetical protein